MKKRLASALLAAALLLIGGFVAALSPAPASAQTQKVCVQLPSGQVLFVDVPVIPGVPLNAPGEILDPSRCAPSTPTTPSTPSTPATPAQPGANPSIPSATTPTTPGRTTPGQTTTTGKTKKPKKDDEDKPDKKGKKKPKSKKADKKDKAKARAKRESQRQAAKPKKKPARTPDGAPTASNPSFMDALPGPSTTTGVPNFVINKFRVPPFLLSIYQAAGIQYGVRWEVLAAINEIETDYGRNLNVSSAGALGWMQFIPSTWRMYGVDANKDGKKDPYNPVDAIFAAARYLKAAGFEKDQRRAVFAYNHADWYVDSVMLRAKLIAGVPADLIGSLTGLTEGRFPVAARARYADDLQEAEATKRVKRGDNAANVVDSATSRRQIEIFAKKGSPVVATNDGQVKKIGQNKKLGRYITLQDVYGNRYTYAHLGNVAREYPVPKADAAADPKTSAKAIKANAAKSDPKPKSAASAGRQPTKAKRPAAKLRTKANAKATDAPAADALPQEASTPVKRRLFAHPDMPASRENGGADQLLDRKLTGADGSGDYKNYFSRPLQANSKDFRLTRLKKGSQVIGGTVLGRVGAPEQAKASHIDFSIRPAGKGAPQIDPKPILDGWKLLEATAVYRASGRNALHGDSTGSLSIGQVLLLPKPLLEKRVLADPRVEIYDGGRQDIESGQIDRRVLATLEFLAESGLKPTVTSLKGNHGLRTASGNISEHSSGNAVDIGAINGTPIAGHQERGGITEQTVRRLMTLQGTVTPHQIISLLDLGANTLAMADHADHIHVGFKPLYGSNTKLGRQALAVLKPGQWSDLLKQLRKIDQPTVPVKPSKYAIPAKKAAGSTAHQGD